MILWNVALILILLTFWLLNGTSALIKDVGQGNIELPNVTSSTSDVPSPIGKFVLVQLLSYVSMSLFCVSSLLLSIYLAVVGPALLNRLSSKANLVCIEAADEYRIAKLILIVQVIVTTITSCFSCHYFLSSSSSLTYGVPMAVMSIFSKNTDSSVLSLIAYKCLTVRQQFRNIAKLSIRSDLGKIYHLVFNIDKSVKELDYYLSPYLMLSLITFQMISISSLCQLAMDHTQIMENCSTVIYGLLNLFIHCYLCNKIPSSLKQAIYTIEVSIDSPVIDANDRIVIIQLKEMSDKIGFTSFGLFTITINTFVSSVGLIITYAVIIIQTGQQ